MRFNESFNDKGDKPWFIYKPNPLVDRAFQIFMYKKDKKDYEPVGDYTVLDQQEDLETSARKVMNLITILNGKGDLAKFDNITGTRILYNVIPKKSEDDLTKVMFRKYDGKGISSENALLIVEKGVFKDE